MYIVGGDLKVTRGVLSIYFKNKALKPFWLLTKPICRYRSLKCGQVTGALYMYIVGGDLKVTATSLLITVLLLHIESSVIPQ